MFGKNNSSGSNVNVNVTLDLSSPAFSGTTTLDSLIISKNTAAKQIILNQATNCWYLDANNGNRLSLGFGSSITNWNSSTFDFYFNGDCKFPGNVNANKLTTRTMIHFGDTDIGDGNTDDTYIQKKFITSGESNASELAINVGDDGTNDTFTLPAPEEPENADYVTITAQDGIHHAFSTSGNYYYGHSIFPKYTNLPALSTLQIGGSHDLAFDNGLYLTGYNYRQHSFPIGYYLVIGHLEVTPDTYNGDYMYFGISTTSNLNNSPYSKYFSFHSNHKDTFSIMYYIPNDADRSLYFIFNATTEVEVTSSKCTFIRIA